MTTTRRETPPAEPLLVNLLALPRKRGLGTLVLVDEALMYARGKAGMGPRAFGDGKAERLRTGHSHHLARVRRILHRHPGTRQGPGVQSATLDA